jgi:serine/threonine protein kinase/TolB-like protein/Tfp pilus assembly protein PilF
MSSREELLFADALAQPDASRGVFLDQECGADAALRARIERLLAAHGAPEPLTGPILNEPVSDSPDEKAGALIGRYKLLQKIGEGGCGIVWMAEQEMPVRRRVALKVIKLGMDTKAVVARFEAERQALAMMDHPNIAKVHDGGATATGRPYFVMELVRGIPITRYCDEANLPTKERLRLFIQICQAVQHAHQKGIIHRDLKPSNILVTVTDGLPVPKVIDFGIAKAAQGRLTESTLFTAFEQFIGTPAYMSPEQAELGSVEIDARSDIYSIGVLLYELLTGRLPFDPKALANAGVDEIRHQIRSNEPPRPSRRLQTLGDAERTSVARLRGTAPAQLSLMLRGDLDWIVMRCLEKNRSRRYDTASALADDIQRHLSHEPVTARPPSTLYLTQKFIRRNRVALGAAAMCTIALAAGVVLSRWQAAREGLSPALSAPAANAVKSVAVLAFENKSGSAENDMLIDGICGELANVLGRSSAMQVAAPRSALSFKGQKVPLSEIAKHLNVTYVVDGSVQRTGDNVRFAVNLTNAVTGFHVWGDNFVEEWKDIYALQEEVARKIAAKLKVNLGDSQRDNRTVIPEAHRLVLEGRYHWSLRDEQGFARAEEAFKKALALDPDYAEAHSGLAEVSVTRMSFRQFDAIEDNVGDIERAKVEARKAIGLDPTLAEPHAVLGFVARLEGRLDSAEGYFVKALELNPNSAVIYTWYALALACRGKLDAALVAYERASTLEPYWFINRQRQAWHLARARRLSEALQINQQAEKLQKDVHLPNRADEAVILFELGRVAEAVSAARTVVQFPDKEPRWQSDSDAIWVLRRTGNETEAAAHADRVLAKWPAGNFNRGFVLAALGRFEEALPFLEKTPATPARGLYWDSMWDEWRNDPRFTQLLEKLGRREDYQVARDTLTRMTQPTAAPGSPRPRP